MKTAIPYGMKKFNQLAHPLLKFVKVGIESRLECNIVMSLLFFCSYIHTRWNPSKLDDLVKRCSTEVNSYRAPILIR